MLSLLGPGARQAAGRSAGLGSGRPCIGREAVRICPVLASQSGIIHRNGRYPPFCRGLVSQSGARRGSAHGASLAEGEYLKGAFGSFFHSEALPGALPPRQNSPQQPPYGLYPELFSGTAFTAPRSRNRYSWLYRILPTAKLEPVTGLETPFLDLKSRGRWIGACPLSSCPPLQLRFPRLNAHGDVFTAEGESEQLAETDFLDGVTTIAMNGNARMADGATANVYRFGKSMSEPTASGAKGGRVFRNNDADMLFLPQDGEIEIRTEFGRLTVEPLEMALIPRGMVMQVLISVAG